MGGLHPPMARPAPILHVEDHPALAELVQVALGDLDVAVTHVATGAAALERIETAPPPRLVLLDLDLPDMRGLEVLERVRARDTGNVTPIVVLSSSECEEDIERAAAGGANSYVVKPPEFETFRESVRYVVRYWLDVHRAPATGEAA